MKLGTGAGDHSDGFYNLFSICFLDPHLTVSGRHFDARTRHSPPVQSDTEHPWDNYCARAARTCLVCSELSPPG